MSTSTTLSEIEIDRLTKTILKPRPDSPERHPRLVLSVVGDSSSFVPKPWLTPVFQLGLIETAEGAKDCVILYKGSNERVSTLVREAVDDFHVMNNNIETKDQSDTCINLIPVGLHPDDKDNVSCCSLDMETYGKDHARILASVAKEYIPFVELKDKKKLEIKVPVLVIVIEGDLSTLDVVVQVLEKCIPVLILQGSGKAADLIAECIGQDQEDILHKANDTITAKAPLLLGIYFQQTGLDKLTKYMEAIIKRKHLVNIFDITQQDETKFPDAVVNSIIRGWAQGEKNEKTVKSASTPTLDQKQNGDTHEGERNSVQRLNGDTHERGRNSVHPASTRTTVTLNNIQKYKGETKDFMEGYQKSVMPASLSLYFYIAYQFIQEMPDESNDDTEEKIKNFQILLKHAIIADRVDYVTVLLQEGKVVFDRKYFPKIYQVIKCKCKNDGDCQHIKSILKGATKKSTKALLKKDKKVKKFNKTIQAGRQLCQKFLNYPKKKYKQKKDEGIQKKDEGTQKEENIYQDLLIWALFANRPKMATLFWMKCENQLLTAILACCVLTRMAEKASKGKDIILIDAFTEHASVFEKRVEDLQTQLYKKDPGIATDLMLTEQTVWDIQVSPLESAFDNAMLDVIAHSCSQRRLNKIWYKSIGSSLGGFWKNGFFCGCKMQTGKDTDGSKLLLQRFFYAPLTRFLVHYFIFLAFLVWFSAFLLTELTEYTEARSILIYEWLIYVWLLGDIFEEYRGILPWNNDVIKSKLRKFRKKDKKKHVLNKQSTWYRIWRYIFDFWNCLDVLSYCITTAAIFVRFLYPDPSARLSRRLYSLSLFTVYMRFLHALLMSRELGPKIIMIKEMLKDLFRFIGILFVFMIGVGVLYHSNMYPAHYDLWNQAGWTYWRIWKIIYIPYWQIYGEPNLEIFEDNSTTPCTTIQSEWESNPDIERCNQYDWVLIVIAALYMLMSNLLLVNLVIALFSYRFEIVQKNSEKLWRYWRYAVIMDYRTRVPAPLNLIIRPFMLIYRCIKSYDGDKDKPDEKAIERMERIQAISANRCIRQEDGNMSKAVKK